MPCSPNAFGLALPFPALYLVLMGISHVLYAYHIEGTIIVCNLRPILASHYQNCHHSSGLNSLQVWFIGANTRNTWFQCSQRGGKLTFFTGRLSYVNYSSLLRFTCFLLHKSSQLLCQQHKADFLWVYCKATLNWYVLRKYVCCFILSVLVKRPLKWSIGPCCDQFNSVRLH